MAATARTTLTQAKSHEYFTPALGAFVTSTMTFSTMHTTHGMNTSDGRFVDRDYTVATLAFVEEFKKRYLNQTAFSDFDISTNIKSSLETSAIAQLGMTCFGYIFERYKRDAGNQEIGDAFGLGDITSDSIFLQRFPTSRTVIPFPPNRDSYWFSSMVRNAFAHWNWEVSTTTTPEITLKNYLPRNNTLTFHVVMSSHDLRVLIYEALYNFINYVQDPLAIPNPSEPLSHDILRTILDRELERLKPQEFVTEAHFENQAGFNYRSEELGGRAINYQEHQIAKGEASWWDPGNH